MDDILKPASKTDKGKIEELREDTADLYDRHMRDARKIEELEKRIELLERALKCGKHTRLVAG